MERRGTLIVTECAPDSTPANLARQSALELWQAGQIDNFEYLLCLNAAAGRSFHDLSRYPVFPWVISSYGERDDDDDELPSKLDLADPSAFRDLSKPVGNLTDERFEYFRKRYDGMVQQQKSNASQHHLDAPFMYGTREYSLRSCASLNLW